MAKSTTEDLTRSSEKRPRSTSRSTNVPLHFAIHKPGCHVESCCGVCNLFPGVLLIAFCQVLVGSILLTLILTHGTQYDEMHQTPTSQCKFALSLLLPIHRLFRTQANYKLMWHLQAFPGELLIYLQDAVFIESCVSSRVFSFFPGVLLIAFCQVLVGSIVLTLILTNGKQYDEMHRTSTSQFMSTATGAVLSGVTGAGLLLIVVALTENCRAMLVYLLVASLVWLSIVSLAVAKISRACVRFQDAPKIKDEQHRLANLACVSGLCTFIGAAVYLFSFMVVFSFYHFRYVRRAILMHEAECQ